MCLYGPQVSTGNLPISLAYLTVSMPLKTAAGNPLLYVTDIRTAPVSLTPSPDSPSTEP